MAAEVEIKREDRPAGKPQHRVFYGTIASGNRPVYDSVLRERVRAHNRAALCCDTDAAGVVSSEMKYLVVRGISHYCDERSSQTHTKWEKFAALQAAAYVKWLLSEMR